MLLKIAAFLVLSVGEINTMIVDLKLDVLKW